MIDVCFPSHVLADQFRIGATATGDLTLLLTAIQTTSKFIATNVRKARLINLWVFWFFLKVCKLILLRIGLAGETNVQGEAQKKLDVLSNDIMINSLRASGKTAVLVSEELDEAVIIEDKHKGHYCVVFDPLDGSSNIDAGVNIGTIFGIYRIVSVLRRPVILGEELSISQETRLERHHRGCLTTWVRDGCCWLHDVGCVPTRCCA